MEKNDPSIESQKRYYGKVWDKASYGLFRLLSLDKKYRKKFIISNVKKITKNIVHPKIIELGCGTGWLCEILSKFGDVFGVDLSCSSAKRLYPNLKFKEVDIIRDEISDRKYHVVVSSEVVEHLTTHDQYIFIKKAHDLLNKDGFLILTTPNKPYAEKLLKECSIFKNQLQPIENWLDEKSLASILEPYFTINIMKSICCYSFFLRKVIVNHRLLYFAASRVFPLYNLIDNFLKSADDYGVYLAVIAQKAS